MNAVSSLSLCKKYILEQIALQQLHENKGGGNV